MTKRRTLVTPGSRTPRPWPEPMPTLWYICPEGEYSRQQVFTGKSEDQLAFGVKCSDGEERDFLPVVRDNICSFDESRKTDGLLHFSVWYKSKTTFKVELWVSDEEGRKRNPSLNPRSGRGLKNSLVTGTGKPAKLPRRRIDTMR